MRKSSKTVTKNSKLNNTREKILSLDVSILFVTQVIAFGISTLVPIILARTLDPQVYGVYRELLLIFTTLQPIFLIGIPHSLKYFYPRFNDEQKKLLLTQTIFLTILSGLIFLLVLIFIGFFGVFFGFEPNWTSYFILLGLYAFFNLNCVPFITILVVVDKVKIAGAIYIVFAIIDVILISLFGVLFKSITGLLTAIVIADFIKFLIYLYFGYKEQLPSLKSIKPDLIKAQLAYSVPIGLSSFVGIINVNVDKYFIALYFTPVIYMFYHFGSYQVPPLRMLISSVTKVLVPELSKEHKNKKYKHIVTLWHETIRKLSILFFPLFAFLMLAANELLIVLFTETYLDATPIFRIYLFLIPLRVFFFTWLLMATGHAKFLFKLSLITLGSNFVMNYLFITYIGNLGIEPLYGPAIATVIVIYGEVLATYYKSKKEIVPEIKQSLVPWAAVAKIGILTIISYLITYFVVYQMLYDFLSSYHPIGILLISFGIFSASYFSLMYYSNAIKEEDIKSIKLLLTGKY